MVIILALLNFSIWQLQEAPRLGHNYLALVDEHRQNHLIRPPSARLIVLRVMRLITPTSSFSKVGDVLKYTTDAMVKQRICRLVAQI